MPMEVVLTEEVTEMEEVVVTGIFIRKAESFTGAATTFKQEDLKRLGNQNILQSLKIWIPPLWLQRAWILVVTLTGCLIFRFAGLLVCRM